MAMKIQDAPEALVTDHLVVSRTSRSETTRLTVLICDQYVSLG